MNKDKKYFDSSTLQVVEPDAIPHIPESNIVRCWDLAATESTMNNPDPDWTVGVKMGKDEDGVLYILDVIGFRKNPADVKTEFVNTTKQDGKATKVYIPRFPGTTGKTIADDLIKSLPGYDVTALGVTGSKETRAQTAANQAFLGNIKLSKGAWNDAVLDELNAFPNGKHDDVVDALSDCVKVLNEDESLKKVA